MEMRESLFSWEIPLRRRAERELAEAKRTILWGGTLPEEEEESDSGAIDRGEIVACFLIALEAEDEDEDNDVDAVMGLVAEENEEGLEASRSRSNASIN